MVRGAFHHALIIPASFLNERSKSGNTKGKIRGEALYDSEDLARHMANYVMNQIPTLSVTHISSSDIIAPDIWSDPFRVYACLFAKASRVLFLVTQYDVAAFGKFTREHLQPLLNQSTPRDYDWKSRFFVLAMGELDLPVPLPCEIIRFREVGWFRDSMALFVLGKKIQEFWTPKQLSSCLITRTEKLKFATNLEETETFQTSLIVKNSNDEDPIDKRGDVQEIFNTKIDHGSAMISNDGPHYIACQNFNVRFDIVSNRSLEIHNLLIPNVSVSGLSGTIQPLQTNVGYYAAQSDIGLIGISSDMDDISPALGEVHSTTDSAGEMQWSPPDSVSVVRETESNSALSPNEGGLTPVTTETDRIRSDVTQTTVTEKASVAAGNADFILESEPPKPTKRTRMVGDQVGSRSIDLSSVRKQHTFFTHERDAPISLSGEDIRSPTTANTSPEGPLETIAERSVESDTSLCPLDCCGFPMQPIPGVQKSEQSPCSDGLETMSTVSRQISPSDYLKIEDGNAITSPKLDSNKKFTPLMGSQCFGEKDEFLKDIESTEIKLQDRKSPSTPFLSLLETTSEVSGSVAEVESQGEESNSRPRNRIFDQLTSVYSLPASSDDLSCQTGLIKFDMKLFYSTNGEPLSSNGFQGIRPYKSNEIRRPRTFSTYGRGSKALQSFQNSIDMSEVKETRKTYGRKKAHGECQSAAQIKKYPMLQCADPRTGKVTTIRDIGDGYFSDTYIERIKPRLTDILNGNFKALDYNKKGSSLCENLNLLSQRGIEKCLSRKQPASEPYSNLAKNIAVNEISNPYFVFSTTSDAQVHAGSTINDKKPLKCSSESTVAGNHKSLSSVAVDTMGSSAIGNVASEYDLQESAVVPKTTKTALMDSDFPSGTKKRVSPHGDLNSSGDKIKCFDVEGSSQVDIDVDLKTSNVPNIRQTSPSISFLQKEGVASTSNSMNLIDKKNKENCGDLDHAGSETDENRSAAPSTSESVPQNYAFHPPNKSAPRRGLWESRLLTIEATKEKIPDASSKISICHKHTIGSKLGERQDSVEGSSGQVRPTDIFENEVSLNKVRRTCLATKAMKLDPNNETCSGSRKDCDVKLIKSDVIHFGKYPRKVYFKDNIHESVSNELSEHTTIDSVDVQNTANADSRGYRSDYPSKNLVKTVPASIVHSNIHVYKAHKPIKAAIPVHSTASREQPTLAFREPSLQQTTDVVEHGSLKRDKTQISDASKSFILGEQSELQAQESKEAMQVNVNKMKIRPESLRGQTEKGEKPKFRYQKPSLNEDFTEKANLKTYNETSKGQHSLTKKVVTPTNNCISFEDMSCGVKWTSHDLSISSPKCRSPISDSDCDPEITSSTMSRPSCLLSADNFPSSIALPKTLPEAATSQADCLKLSILRGNLKSNKQNDALLPHHYAASGAEVIKRRERLEEHKPNIEKRFSSISITDEVNQREFEVADTAVGSSYSELGDFRLPSASSVGLLHEAGEYQRNLSTQVQSSGKRHEIEAHGPYFRVIQEKFDNDGGPSTYWCDRSVGSPTPCGFSARSDTTSDSSVPSEKSRVFIEDAEITTNSRQRTVNALFSVCKALGKASKLLSFSNEIIMRQIEQLNSEQP